MVGRGYDDERDLAAVTRIWREVGWIDDDNDTEEAALEAFLSAGATLVADIDDVAECAVHRSTGSIRLGDTDLPLCAITAVTTSHVARKQHLASVLTAEALAEGHAAGAAVGALGMFEQGFYDRLGFGSTGYALSLRFDPSSLTVEVPDRPPVRIGPDDAAEFHQLLVRRHRGHGSVVLDPPELITAELGFIEKPFGLGFRAADGRLTHALYGSRLGEYGPYRIEWMAYEEPAQLLELLGLLRGLSDQVATVEITEEPAEIQLQDLLREPIRQRHAAQQAGRPGSLFGAIAWRQMRIMDLPAVVAATPGIGEPARFGVRVTDPLVDRGGPWPGIGGEYTITLGDESYVVDGIDHAVDVLDVSVNALTRLLTGVRPASSLVLTDNFVAPPQLVDALDRAIRLPQPKAGWQF